MPNHCSQAIPFEHSCHQPPFGSNRMFRAYLTASDIPTAVFHVSQERLFQRLFRKQPHGESPQGCAPHPPRFV
jgi:hypothetical protein